MDKRREQESEPAFSRSSQSSQALSESLLGALDALSGDAPSRSPSGTGAAAAAARRPGAWKRRLPLLLMLSATLLGIAGVWLWWASQRAQAPGEPFRYATTLTVRTSLIDLERAVLRRNDDLRWDREAFLQVFERARGLVAARAAGDSQGLSRSADQMVAAVTQAAQSGGPSVDVARSAIAALDTQLAAAEQLDARADAATFAALVDERVRAATAQAILISMLLASMFGTAYVAMLYRLQRQRSQAERAMLISRTRRAKEEATEALVAKNNLLAMISHELRSPIQTVVSSLDLLVSGDADPARIVPRVRRSAQSLLTLIGDLMQLAKAESVSLTVGTLPMAVSAIVAQACDSRRAEAQDKGLRLVLQVNSPSPVVLGDPARLAQVVDNLVANAVQYTAKGSITISTTDPDPQTGEYTVSVRDTGIGISVEDQRRLFKPFTRLHPSSDERRRSGMGLTIVRALVHSMGGRVEVKSSPGAGSTFTVCLPAKHLLNVPLRTFETTEIMVVDDEPDVLASVTDVLSQAGAPVVGVSGGYDALRTLEIGGEPPTLMLIDLNMPGMPGIELAAAIKRRAAPRRPILVAMSASINLSSLGDNHFDGALPKPVNRETLLSLVASLSLPVARQ